jgi:hypothetical protein
VSLDHSAGCLVARHVERAPDALDPLAHSLHPEVPAGIRGGGIETDSVIRNAETQPVVFVTELHENALCVRMPGSVARRLERYLEELVLDIAWKRPRLPGHGGFDGGLVPHESPHGVRQSGCERPLVEGW